MGVTTEKARAQRLANVATKQLPVAHTNAGRVLAAIEQWPGLPTWEIARNTHLSTKEVTGAAYYLKKQGLIFAHYTEYFDPKRGGERIMQCWFRVRRGPSVVASTHCEASMGYGALCNTRLEARIDAFGRVTFACPACERRNAGRCRTCPRPTPTAAGDGRRPWFCATCLAARRKQRQRARQSAPDYHAQRKVWDDAYRARQRRGAA